MPLLLNALFSSVAFSHFMVDVFNASRPVLVTYLGLTETQIALISTIYIWVSALTQPFFGWVSDRTGPRWLAAGSVSPYSALIARFLSMAGPGPSALENQKKLLENRTSITEYGNQTIAHGVLQSGLHQCR